MVGLFLGNNDGGNQAVVERNLFRDNDQPGAASGNAIYLDQFTAGGTVNNVLITENSFLRTTTRRASISASTDPVVPRPRTPRSRNNLFDSNGNAFRSQHDQSHHQRQHILNSNGTQLGLLGGNNNVTSRRTSSRTG